MAPAHPIVRRSREPRPRPWRRPSSSSWSEGATPALLAAHGRGTDALDPCIPPPAPVEEARADSSPRIQPLTTMEEVRALWLPLRRFAGPVGVDHLLRDESTTRWMPPRPPHPLVSASPSSPTRFPLQLRHRCPPFPY
ncbi:hypothetical protein U9M48_026745 [Paspalum notatum var. saurae]|uniref:Uncharacterized protein n=1 Tax=Paspalum notatum var. saurae TaxID=547442 RepID=A0AAQ3TV50_PASNO